MNKAISFFTLLASFTCLHLHAQLVQEVKISNVAIIPKINHAGATSMQVNYALTFKYSRADKLHAKDSSDDHYRIELRLETDKGLVLAQDGYELHADSGNAAMFSDQVILYENKYYAGEAMFLPLAALRLDTGMYRIRALLRCYDHDHKLMGEFHSDFTSFRMPQHQALKIMMRDITVTYTDPSGEAWDYYVFNAVKSRPDIFWELHYGDAIIHTSQTQWDSYEWTDTLGSGDYLFHVVKGDVLRIKVYDRDIYTPNDFIGATDISTGANCCDSKMQKRKFNYVLNMSYAISGDMNNVTEAPVDSLAKPNQSSNSIQMRK